MRLLLRILGGLLLLAVVVWIVDPAQLTRTLSQVRPGFFIAALVIAVLSNVMSAVRWSHIAKALGMTAPVGKLAAMYARGMTSNTLLPGATLSGDLLRSYELSQLGNPLVRATASVAFDRFSGLWVLCVLSLIAAGVAMLFNVNVQAQGAHVLPVYGALLAAIALGPLLPWPVGLLRNTRFTFAHRIADLWDEIHDRRSPLRQQLAQSLGLSLIVQLLSATALAVCGASLGVHLPYPLYLAAAAPIFVMAALPIGVAGFGTRELASVAILGALGVSGELAAGTGLLYGVCGVLQGILAAPLFLMRR